MTKIQLWKVGTVLVIAIVIFLTLVLGIQPRIIEIQSNAQTVMTFQQQKQLQQLNLEKTIKLSQNKTELELTDRTLSSAIPADMGISDFVRQLNTIATDSGVTITEVEISEPAQYQAPEQLAENTQLNDAVSGLEANSLYSVGVGVKVTGTLDSLQQFIGRLQNNSRTTLPYAFTLQAGQDGGNYSLAITAEIFVHNKGQ